MSDTTKDEDLPKFYIGIRKRYKDYGKALSDLGQVLKEAGPVNEKNAQLIQLAASAAIGSEGAVHSHARRAIESGASPEEVYHSLILLTSTIGFPNVSAAISWVDDLFKD